MALATLRRQTFAFEFGLPVGVERIGCIVFFPRLGSAAVEDVIGAVMHQPRAQTLRFFRQHAHGGSVDGACQFGFAFGFIDGGVSRRIHNHVGRDGTHGLRKGFELRQIQIAVKRDHFAQGREAALQFPTDLAFAAEEQNF